jgi:hypothetical protein
MGVKLRDSATALDFEIAGKGSGDWISTKINLKTHYKTTKETLESRDLIRIKQSLDKLINGEVTELEILKFAEADIEIALFPGNGWAKPWMCVIVDFVGELGVAGVAGQIIKAQFNDVIRLRDYLAKRIAELGLTEGLSPCP